MSISMAMMSFGPNLQQVWPELEGDLFGSDDGFPLSDGFIDPYFQSDELLYSKSYTNCLPYEEFESCHYPKRKKCFDTDFTPTFFDGNVTNYNNPAPEFLPQQIQVSSFDCGNTESCVKKVSLLAQSIAARERRKKITEKTQELGKMIPGGNKLNTAEMFHAASKYVKFLQAQVALLEVMASLQEEQEMEPSQSQELQILLTSPSFQEKLYSEEKCLVPQEFIQSKLSKMDNIEQFLQKNG